MKLRVAAIVQARLGSTRLRGKMLMPLGGLPILEWVLRRVVLARRVDQVVLATSDRPADAQLATVAERFGVAVLRGSEEDVLGRFVSAAALARADLVVRVCADNPFIDPDEVDRLIDAFDPTLIDYACNHQHRLGSRYADGFGAEILGVPLLRAIAGKATEPRHREHVTLYLWDHAASYRLKAVAPPPELAQPTLRFDLDTADDYAYLASLVASGVTPASTAQEIVALAMAKARIR
jgi:spore coat polysaccharide biosynthesis protein SpsF